MNYTLKNDHLNVVVDTFGAEMHSIQHDDIEYLWQADAKFWGPSCSSSLSNRQGN